MSLLGSASCGGKGCAGLGQPLAPDLAGALVEAPALVDDAEGKALLRAVAGHDVSINTPSDTYLPAERSSRSSAQAERRSTSSRATPGAPTSWKGLVGPGRAPLHQLEGCSGAGPP